MSADWQSTSNDRSSAARSAKRLTAVDPLHQSGHRIVCRKADISDYAQIGVVGSNVGRTLIVDQYTPTGEQLHRTGADLVSAASLGGLHIAISA